MSAYSSVNTIRNDEMHASEGGKMQNLSRSSDNSASNDSGLVTEGPIMR